MMHINDIHELPSWNRRYQEYMKIIHRGDKDEIRYLEESLEYISTIKVLSFGERKMKELCGELLDAREVKHLRVIRGGRQ